MMLKHVSICVAIAFALFAYGTTIVDARPSAPHHRLAPTNSHEARTQAHGRAGRSGLAEIVVDANNGRTLYALNENERRFPASITKVMTLYLLFEHLENGTLRLDSLLEATAHAASQASSKVGLRPGQTIDVQNAIEAVVTKSANDVAVAIAEELGGDERSFAEMMTEKARDLSMSRTNFVNATGLPDERQTSTARDLATLGKAIRERFPDYFRYFATRRFSYHGRSFLNHNHLLGRVTGMDGIKTGFIRASGYNLLASISRNGRNLIAVVLGGPTAGWRDRAMARLVETNIGKASPIGAWRDAGSR